MLRIALLLNALALATITLCAQAAEPAKSTTSTTAASKWEKSIAEFEAKDKQSPPPKDAVLFVGSSTIRLWDTDRSFPDLVTINRGFGGSQMSDAAHFARRLINVYRPRVVVLYEGDNDLGAKKTPQQVAEDFDSLLKTVRADLPTTPIIVIGIKPSPKRWALIDQQRAANKLLADRCEKDGHATFLSVEKPMLGDDGQPKASLFREDDLHLSDEGYKLWNSLVGPAIQKALAGDSTQ
jgi:lysophospholipase L1-like esterase